MRLLSILLNRIIFLFFQNILKKNKVFKGKHLGESCYIFGNGSSIKFFDLEKFNDKIAIGCGSFFLHKDFNKLRMKYYYVGHPLFLYKFWKNPYYKKYEINKTGKMYYKNIHLNGNITFFLGLSNFFGLKSKNIKYVYHFGKVSLNVSNADMSSGFSSMSGSLQGMLGMAIYMGFKDITLVGCDYLSNPAISGHFYEFGKGEYIGKDKIFFQDTILSIDKDVNVSVVTINKDQSGMLLKSVDYQTLTGGNVKYKENCEIISFENLKILESLNLEYKIFEKK